MTDKVQKIREEVERLKEIAEYNISHSKMDRSAWMQQASVCTNLLSFINSLKKEPVIETQVKESLISKHEDKTCKENGNSLTQEPASEDLEKEVYEHLWKGRMGTDVSKPIYFSYDELLEVARHFAAWQKQQMERYRIEHCKSLTNEQAELEDNFVSSHVEKNNRIPTFIDAIEYGIEYGKQQILAKAVDATVHIDAGGYSYIPQMELYDYDKDIPLAKEGDKYKIILIKED